MNMWTKFILLPPFQPPGANGPLSDSLLSSKVQAPNYVHISDILHLYICTFRAEYIHEGMEYI